MDEQKEKALHAFNKFMEAWKEGDLLTAYEFTQLTFRDRNDFQTFHDLFKDKKLTFFKEVTVVSVNDYIVDVTFDLGFDQREEGKDWPKAMSGSSMARIIFEEGPFKPSVDGFAGVNPPSVLVNQKGYRYA